MKKLFIFFTLFIFACTSEVPHDMEGQLEERTAERDAINSMAQEFHSQLIAIDKIRTFRPRNEIVERKLLVMNNA